MKDASADPFQDDDDDDAPGECHCVGTKQLCNTAPAPEVDAPDDALTPAVDVVHAAPPPAPVFADGLLTLAHRADAPLYLTLRALRI